MMYMWNAAEWQYDLDWHFYGNTIPFREINFVAAQHTAASRKSLACCTISAWKDLVFWQCIAVHDAKLTDAKNIETSLTVQKYLGQGPGTGGVSVFFCMGGPNWSVDHSYVVNRNLDELSDESLEPKFFFGRNYSMLIGIVWQWCGVKVTAATLLGMAVGWYCALPIPPKAVAPSCQVPDVTCIQL